MFTELRLELTMTIRRNLQETYGVIASLEEVARRLHLGLPAVNALAHGFPAEPDPILWFHLARIGLNLRSVLRFHLAGVGLNLAPALRFHLAGVGLNPIRAGLAHLAHRLAAESYPVLPFHLDGLKLFIS